MIDKPELIGIFRDLFESFRSKLLGFIGKDATYVIIQTAEKETTREYPFLKEFMTLNNDTEFLDSITQIEYEKLRNGLLHFINILMELIIELTGSVLVQKVEPILINLKNRLEGD